MKKINDIGIHGHMHDLCYAAANESSINRCKGEQQRNHVVTGIQTQSHRNVKIAIIHQEGTLVDSRSCTIFVMLLQIRVVSTGAK